MQEGMSLYENSDNSKLQYEEFSSRSVAALNLQTAHEYTMELHKVVENDGTMS
jgi:hypothetical protein